MIRSRNVLVNVNGSLEPLRQALEMAERENWRVTALKVLPKWDGNLMLTGTRSQVLRLITSERAAARKQLDDMVRGEPAARARVEHGDASRTISRVAAEEGCDLIILGNAKDAGLLHRWLDGRLVNQVTRLAHCPVLVLDS